MHYFPSRGRVDQTTRFAHDFTTPETVRHEPCAALIKAAARQHHLLVAARFATSAGHYTACAYSKRVRFVSVFR